jgi:hypothetical protein
MHSAIEPAFRRGSHGPKTEDNPVLAMAYSIAGEVMEIAGPLFWAVLLLAFIASALGIGSSY